MEVTGMDATFRALADPSRRALLDRLRERDGQTLGEVCSRLVMARQSATQHLDVLSAANLITIVRRGRERLHYLNSTPIHEVAQRWISEFDAPRLNALSNIKSRAEESSMTIPTAPVPTFIYTTYIRATAEQIWHALTDADLTARYWGHANVSGWEPGSSWEHRRVDGSGIADAGGRVIEVEPPTRLVVSFDAMDGLSAVEVRSVVTFLIEPHDEIARLTVTHESLPDSAAFGDASHGWPAVMANLKSLLETGDQLPSPPWEMPQVSAL